MFGCHKEVTRLGRMMGRLLGDVVTFGTIWVIPVACEYLTEDWIKRLLHAPKPLLVVACGTCGCLCARGFDMPSAEVELRYGDKSFYRVFDFRNRKHSLRMGHEAVTCVSAQIKPKRFASTQTHFVMRSSIDRGSRMKVGRVTRLKSAPGRSWDIICMSTVTCLSCQSIPVVAQSARSVLEDVLLPCSESMTVSSSLVTSSPCCRDSSMEDPRLPD